MTSGPSVAVVLADEGAAPDCGGWSLAALIVLPADAGAIRDAVLELLRRVDVVIVRGEPAVVWPGVAAAAGVALGPDGPDGSVGVPGRMSLEVGASVVYAVPTDGSLGGVVADVGRRHPGYVLPGAAADDAAELVGALTAAGRTVACAESLTAGLLAGRVAGVPGASRVLRGGVVAYATDLKASLLDVPAEVLARDGAVSEACARAMAVGVATRCGATDGLALTGVAGPDPQEGHLPGTVWLARHGPDGTFARLLPLSGDRARIRADAVTAALRWLREAVGGAGR